MSDRAPVNPAPMLEDYVILVRHAARKRDPALPEEAHGMAGQRPPGWRERIGVGIGGSRAVTPPAGAPPRAEPGGPVTRELAGDLADQLTLEKIWVTRMVHSRHKVAVETAELIASILKSRGSAPPTLTPVPSFHLTPGSSTGRFPADLPPPEPVAKPGMAPAIVLVGHQPDLTRIARSLLQRPRGLVPPPWFVSGLPAGCLPLDNSEMACVRTKGTARLRWILGNKPPELLVDLRDKIRSKLDVAKFFVSALVINGGILLNKDLWALKAGSRCLLWLVAGGFACLAVALGFAVCTLLAYDRLAMPPTFWSDAGQSASPPDPPRWTVLRPPSQAHVILFYEMVHVWNWYFTPALVFSLVAITCLIASMMIREIDAGVRSGVAAAALVVIGLVGWAIYALYEYGKPRLGFDD